MRAKGVIFAGLAMGAALASPSMAAHAKTFELAYTGNRLSRNIYDKGIKHIKRILITVSSDRPFPGNTCFDVPFDEISRMTDGVDSLQTLAAAGYTLYPDGYEFNLCSDETGKHILSWTVEVIFTEPSNFGDLQNGYFAETYSSPPEGFFDFVGFDIAKGGKGHKYTYYGEDNTAAAGSWKFKVTGR